MKRVNKILILFFIFVAVLLSLAWKFIQSERFAQILMSEVERKLIRELNAQVDFEKIQLQLFPPATILKNVKFLKEEGQLRLSIDAESLILDFGIGSFFTSKFLIDKISIQDGRLDLIHPDFNLSKLLQDWQNGSENKKIVVGDIYKFYQEKVYNIIGNRIKTLGLTGVYLKLNLDQVYLSNFDIELNKNFARTRLDLQNPVLDNTTGLEGVIPDEFSFHGDIYKSVLMIENLALKTKFERLFLTGRAFGDNELNLVVTGEYNGLLNNLNKRFEHDLTHELTGEVSLKLGVSGAISNPVVNLQTNVRDIDSRFFSIDSLDAGINIKDQIVTVGKLNIKKGKGEIQLKKEFKLYDLKSKKLDLKEIDLALRDYHTNDALKAIASAISPLKGYLSGDVAIFYDSGSFLFNLKPGFRLDDFRLQFGEDAPILSNAGFVFNESELLLDKNLDLGIDVKMKFHDGYLDAKGKIDDKGIDVLTSKSKIDLDKFGPISGVSLSGLNQFKLKAVGPWSDVKLNFIGEIEKFGLLDFYLPKLSYEVVYEVNHFKLDVPKAHGQLLDGSLAVDGSINFKDKAPLNLNFIVDKLGYQEARKVIKPIFELLPWSPDSALLSLDTTLSLKGGFKPSELDIRADVHADKMKVALETFDKLDFSLTYKNGELNLSDLIIKKKKGILLGNLALRSGSDFLLDLKINQMKLEDFEYYNLLRLGLEGNLNGSFSFQRSRGVDKSSMSLYATECKISNIFVPDSSLNFDLDHSSLQVKGNLFSGDLMLDSKINTLNSDRTQNSKVKVIAKSRSLKSLLGIFASHNILDQSLEGVMDAELNVDFNPYAFENLSANLNINQFVFSRDDFNVKAKKLGRVISINKGNIDQFAIEVEGSGNSLIINGSGRLNQNLLISGKSKIDASMSELVTNKIADVKGFFDSKFNLNWTKSRFSNFVEASGENISFLYKEHSLNVSNVNFKSTLNNDDFYLKELTGDVGGGKLFVSGEAELLLPFPRLNFALNAVETSLSILEKSKIIASSKLELKGETPPYQIRGAVSVLYGLIEDDVERILGDKYKDKKFERYIPQGVFAEGSQLFALNISVSALNEVRILNSLMDLGLRGRAQITGGFENSQIIGDLQFVPVSSKIKFRGHDFIIDSGFIEIEETNKQTESNLKLSALSTIDQYSIKMDIASLGDEVQINLSSSPPLAQEDILSLMTLGYTSDINKKLTEGDRQSVASVGVGSLLVERFKLGETLNSSFGLQLSVAPEFGEADGSMLQSSGGAQTPTNQLRSATKISVRKKVNKRLGLSLSSTVGGSLDQKQEMNVDFDINKYLTIQGVYEVKEVDDDSNADPDSIGLDLRWRHTTK